MSPSGDLLGIDYYVGVRLPHDLVGRGDELTLLVCFAVCRTLYHRYVSRRSTSIAYCQLCAAYECLKKWVFFRCTVAATTVLVYDFCLTFGDEVRRWPVLRPQAPARDFF